MTGCCDSHKHPCDANPCATGRAGPEVHADVVGQYFVCRERLFRPQPSNQPASSSEIKTGDYMLRLKVWNVCGSKPVCYDALVGERSCVFLRSDGTFWVEYGWLYLHVDCKPKCQSRKTVKAMHVEEQVAKWVESERIEAGADGCALVVWVRPHQQNGTNAHRVFYVQGGTVYSRHKPKADRRNSNWHPLTTTEQYDEVEDNGKYTPDRPRHICEGFLNSVKQKVLMVGLPW